MVRKSKNMLVRIKGECLELLGKVDTHLGHLSDLMENPFTYDSQTFRTEHGELEEEVASFIKNYRLAKKETFKVMEHLMDSREVEEHL